MNIRKQFEDNGYELIDNYKNVHSPCLCVCKNCKQKLRTCLHSLKKAKIKCKNCYNYEIKIFFENQSCTLLSKPDRSKKLDYICSCGNNHSTTWFEFKNGTRCRKCFQSKLSNNNSKKQKIKKEIKSYFEKNGCVLLDEYKDQFSYLNFICSCGTKDKVRWKQFKKGSRCSRCAKEKIKNRHVPKGQEHFRWNPNREEINLRKTIRSRIKKSLIRTLREINKEKIKKTWDYLDYSKNELIAHIKKHPNWESIKNLEWELDHKFPIKAFLDHKIYDLKIINSLKNLQPLKKEKNRSKGSFYIEKEFLDFINQFKISAIADCQK